MIPDYRPPTDTRPITPEVYVLLRSYIEAGCAATAAYLAGGGEQLQLLQSTRPRTYEMALALYEFVPASLISLEPAILVAPKIGYPLPIGDVDRPGWPTFVDRTALLEALDKATPIEVRAEVGDLDRPPDASGLLVDLPSATVGGSEWWMIALGAGGILAWLGRRSIGGFLVSLIPRGKLAVIARGLFRLLAAAGIITAITHLGKTAIENVSSAGRKVMPLVLGGVTVAALFGGALFLSRRRVGGRV